MTQQQTIDDDEIDLRQLIAVLRRRGGGIIGFSLLATLLTALFVFSMEPVYRATTMLLIEVGNAKAISIDEVYNTDSQQSDYFKTQFEILKSRELARRVVQKLNITQYPEYGQGDASASITGWRSWLPQYIFETKSVKKTDELTLTAQFMGNLKIEPVRRSQLVKISFESHSAILAAKAANQLAQSYIKGDLEARIRMTKDASEMLTTRLIDLRKNLEQSERMMQSYRDKSDLIDVEGVRSIAVKQLNELSSRLSEERKTFAMTKNLYLQVNKLKQAPLEQLETIPAVLKHPLVQRFKQNEAQIEGNISDLSKRYGPKHPKMKSAMAELASAKQSTFKQIMSVLDGVGKEYEISAANMRSLESELSGLKLEVKNINRKEQQLRILERDVTTNRRIYDMFLNRFKETNVSGDFQSTIARVIDPAIVSDMPFKPKKKLIILLALALSVMFGMFIAFLLEYLDQTFKTADDVEKNLGLPVLGIIPHSEHANPEEDKIHRRASLDSQSVFSETIRSIRTGIMLSGIDDEIKTIVITSTIPDEGKTTVAANLAITFGQVEKVLLIDADMRRPSLGENFEIPKSTSGLAELVAGTATPKECIQQLSEDNIWLLPAGTVPPNPLELLSSKRFSDVLKALGQNFDRIIIDSAPTQPVSDSMVLSRLSDVVVYVVKADSTNYKLAQHGVKRMHSVNAPIIGVVLNALNFKKAAKYHSSYDYYGYADYSQES